jgi:hypothetical protein
MTVQTVFAILAFFRLTAFLPFFALAINGC